MRTIGTTTTVPSEVLLAAGCTPVDLNNVFINHAYPDSLVNAAENAGFPQTCCTWIKGIFGACMEGQAEEVICVTTGDCSNTTMLMEVLRLKGIRALPFAYPDRPDGRLVYRQLKALATQLDTTMQAAARTHKALASCRRLLMELDRLTWEEGLVSGWENHLWLVSSSDFDGDAEDYQKRLRQFLLDCRKRHAHSEDIRLAYIGVPPIFARDMYRFVESQGARIVFNEVQRQFSMPHPCKSLSRQYTTYTYPYSMKERLEDILPELARRQVDGVIHYVQAFCHRGIGDIIIRDAVKLPLLTIEGNHDFVLTPNLRTKMEAFLDMLRRGRRWSYKVGDCMKGSSYGFGA